MRLPGDIAAMGQALQSYVSFANKEDSFDQVKFQMVFSLCLLISRDYRFSPVFLGGSPVRTTFREEKRESFVQ
jgi:hypothetical protein